MKEQTQGINEFVTQREGFHDTERYTEDLGETEGYQELMVGNSILESEQEMDAVNSQ